ncbi:MAG: pseudouridine synthase [Thermaceae bacterium]|nr:pseudouridine synthase [Thermaceae bacterium]
MNVMRLQQYLARAGVTSRRKAEDLIRAGRVSINDKTAQIGAVVGENDVVRMDGERVRLPQRTVVIMLNKPKGYTTTHEDKHAEKLVYELVPEHLGLHSVGRLDKDTEGLLLLTNDGELTQFLSHPRNQIPKLYRAWSKRGRLSEEDCRKLTQGVMLGDGLAKAVEARAAKEGVKLVLTEGKKREVRRMLGNIGHPVERLVRLAVGPIELGELGLGEWRYLSPEEVRLLKHNAPVQGLRPPSERRTSRPQVRAARGKHEAKPPREKTGIKKTSSRTSFLAKTAGSARKADSSPNKPWQEQPRAPKPKRSFGPGEAVRKPKPENPLARGKAQQQPRPSRKKQPEQGQDSRPVSQKPTRAVQSSREHLSSRKGVGTNQRSANRSSHPGPRRTNKK